MSALNTALWCAVAAGVSTVLHELTHVLAAVALGRFETFDVWSWEVLYRVRDPPGRHAYLIAGAPLLVGIAAVPLALVVPVSLPLLVGWTVYTVLGAATQDFAFRGAQAA